MKRYTLFHLLMIITIAGLAGCGGNAAPQTADSPTEKNPEPESTPAIPVPTSTPAATEETGPWKTVFRTARVQHQATVIGFLNETFGITAGYAGEVHYTTDGGKTWPQGAAQSACRFGLEIVDENLAWTIGNWGEVRYSNDGGKTWQAAGDIPASRGHLISFIDAATGWAGNYDNLFATGDGGKTWTDIVLPQDLKGITAIHLRTSAEGFLVDSGGTLYVTNDGGLSWIAKPLDLEKPISPITDLPMGVVRFTDSGHGVIIVNLKDSGGALTALWTADGGTTWTREILPVKVGVLFLTRDAEFLTVFTLDSHIVLLRHQPSAE
jgi:photosystem II stability/assembly factor-like uncharacterized protein